jgi:tyrosyl-tRNA synthetase
MNLMTFFDELEWRGLVYDSTEGARELLASRSVTCYIGFDTTASSLHIGSLLPILALVRARRFGHTPIAVVGEGTGLIGDPSGKSAERTLLTVEQARQNAEGVRAQLAKFLDAQDVPNRARLVNNAEWLGGMSAMEFLRDVGKYFTVNYMLSKESVKRRIESEEGISYTEFSYLVLQAYDFLVLHDRFGCLLQMGGSDQWGNIVAGCDLIRKLRGASAQGLVLPLVTTAAGTKFGKTEAGAVWLDPERTSPFKFYQFWLNVDDRDAVPYLKYFTFLSREEIAALEETLTRAPERRDAQRALAGEVTRLVHGGEQLQRVERASALLFGEGISAANVEDVLMVFEDAPSTSLEASAFSGPGLALVEVLARVGLASSKGEATRLVRSGGVYVNNRRVGDERARLRSADAIGGRIVVLRKGARHYHLVQLS